MSRHEDEDGVDGPWNRAMSVTPRRVVRASRSPVVMRLHDLFDAASDVDTYALLSVHSEPEADGALRSWAGRHGYTVEDVTHPALDAEHPALRLLRCVAGKTHITVHLTEAS